MGAEIAEADRRVSAPARLVPVLTFAWLNSLGTGAVANGVFFVADERYGFSPQANLALGMFMGLVYIAGALGVGPALRWAARRFRWVTTRRAMGGQMLAMAGLCAVPVSVRSPEALWLFTLTYMPLIGGLWPIVESYVSGGRRGEPLRRATGGFNLSWTSAVAAAYWGMAPLLETEPLLVILGLGVMHVGCVPLLSGFPAEPARHVEDVHEPHPVSYVGLLHCLRWLLALSYILLAALTPLLPWKLGLLGVDVGWKTPLASAWMVSRVAMVVWFRRWSGWHGRWRTPAWAGGVMLAGLAATLLAPDLAVVAIGLATFGVGIGGVYAAALYYAMEVGAAEVDAGGKHEALIGLGYAVGPMTGLAAWRIVDAGWAPESAVNAITLGFVCLVTAAGVAAAVLSAMRALRAARSGGVSASSSSEGDSPWSE